MDSIHCIHPCVYVNMYYSHGGWRVVLIERLNCTAALAPTSLFGEFKRNLELLKLDIRDAPKHQFCRVSFDIPPIPFENSVEHVSHLLVRVEGLRGEA